ncbi:MAG: hypothetical protein N2035_03450 [Chthoniobacterales bacterium]|nr:hypothetical protein [Chthoniobacterales bacterium]
MRIEPQILDDFKTDRAEIAPPLPQAARLIPILFYICVAASLILFIIFTINLTNATRQRDQFRAKTQQAQSELNTLRNERASLEAKAKRATDLQLWTECTRPIQPLIVAIARSLERDASIAELYFSRNSASQQNLDFRIRLNSTSQTQLDKVINRLLEMRYRAYSPEQKYVRGQIEFQATLIYQQKELLREEEQTPTAAQSQLPSS